MPVMDGMESVRKIREFEMGKGGDEAKIFMVSGNCGESMIKECLDKDKGIQAQEFFKKPVDLMLLSESLKKWVLR